MDGIIIWLSGKAALTWTAQFVADVTIRSIAPGLAMLPVTETDCQSHRTTADLIAEHGAPATFVRDWLDAAGPRRTGKPCRPPHGN